MSQSNIIAQIDSRLVGSYAGDVPVIDWAQAGFIGGVGFATVFVVLVALAVVVWLSGIVVRRTSRNEPEN